MFLSFFDVLTAVLQSSLLAVVDMHRGLCLVAALTLVAPSVRGWLCGIYRPRPNRGGVRARTRMSCSQAVRVEELWPHLAGKQTSASDAAGKVQG